MRRHILVTASLVALAWSSSVEAAPVQVSNPTELRNAIAAAKAGDEIILAAGTYTISGANIACSVNGTQAAPIIVRSATPLAAKLEMSTVEGFLVSGAHWRFEGLDIKGTCANDANCEHAFHVVGGAEDFVLRNNRIVDFNAQLKVNALTGATPKIPHRGLIEGNELFDSKARNVATGVPVTKLNIDTGDDWIVRGNYIHDFHRTSGGVTYGAFMKSGGKNGLFERNLVLCSKDVQSGTVQLGLSFGGGGTGAAFCAPAFDPGVPCSVEHDNGMMRNNIIASCNDAGIYINRGKNTKLLHNTLVTELGIDFRYSTTTGEAHGNVLLRTIRNRDAATHTAGTNLLNVSQATFEQMYMAPLAGDFRKKGDLSALLGKAPMNANVPDDYCIRARSGTWDLGALQHSLGDCTTFPPPQGGGGSSSGDGGTSSSSSSSSSSGGSNGDDAGSSGGPEGSSGTPPGGSNDGPSKAGDDDDVGGCGCRTTRTSDVPTLAFAGVAIALGLGLSRVRRRR